MQEDQNPLFFLGVPRGNHEAPIFFFSGAGGGGGGGGEGGRSHIPLIFGLISYIPLISIWTIHNFPTRYPSKYIDK